MHNTPIATASAIVLAGLMIYALGSKYLTNFKTNTPATHG
jgi:putative effector of murein hydrolase